MKAMDHRGSTQIEPERYELEEPIKYLFEVERREFFRVLGGGILVAVALAEAGAQESGRGGEQGRGPAPDLAAWLHIDEQGRITVYTGKTEIGQNIRTSLAQTVGDELGAPITSISLVMADTDLVPFDAGTFGSLTTPRMAPQLARAAATAREMLIERAATAWQADRAKVTLTVRDGRVLHPDGRSVAFGELTKGQKLTGVVAEKPATSSADRWTLRGQPVKKVNGRDFVTGRHQYTSDIGRPGMLHGRIVRPDANGATPDTVDDSKARAMTGVTVVRDGDFIGVVAPNERAASRAAEAIRVEWRIPEGLPTSETVYEHYKKTEAPAGARGPSTSLRASGPVVAGDVAQARAQAARVFETAYRIPYIAHVPLEPRAAVAEWKDGRLTVWTGTQRPFGVRSELASAFRIAEEAVRVIVPDTGSAYGGKHSGEHAIEAARLAKTAGKPVKLVWTRAEEFSGGYLRPGGLIEVKSAVDTGGRILAWEFDNWNSGASAIRTPYDIPNQRIQFHPANSPLRQGSYRGLAATANHYAREMQMDEMARALGRDAVEFRMAHLKDTRMRDVLAAVAKKSEWGKPRTSSKDRSLGIACGTEKGSYVATAAEVSKASGGFKVERLVVAFECGAIVNPDGLHNQVEGAVVQGLGGALFEAISFTGGRILNGTLEQYRVPRFSDIPPIEIELLDRRDLPSAGAGETPIVCVAPAIGSAVRALGPVSPALPVRLT
jgi:CO/xanthine dehydrogenase Mo-binding subunit